MIKLIVLLVAWLGLLPQSNGEQPHAEPSGRVNCPNYLYNCMGKRDGKETEIAKICVEYIFGYYGCIRIEPERHINKRCQTEMVRQPNSSFTRAVATKEKCQLRKK